MKSLRVYIIRNCKKIGKRIVIVILHGDHRNRVISGDWQPLYNSVLTYKYSDEIYDSAYI